MAVFTSPSHDQIKKEARKHLYKWTGAGVHIEAAAKRFSTLPNDLVTFCTANSIDVIDGVVLIDDVLAIVE